MEIEVSKKVRAAIKAKLVELGVHVDEELPDYVMVLVANRRSRVQMEQDLNLFLGDNTGRFVIWLHHVLKKLDEVTAHLPLNDKKRKSSIEEIPSTKKSKTVISEEKDEKAVKVVETPMETSKIEEGAKKSKDKSVKDSKKPDKHAATITKEVIPKVKVSDLQSAVVKPLKKNKGKDKDLKKDKESKKDKSKHKVDVKKDKESKKVKEVEVEVPKEETEEKSIVAVKQCFKFKVKSNSKKIGKSSIVEEEDEVKTQKLSLLDKEDEEEFISLNVNANEFEFDELENLRQVALDSQKKKAAEEKEKEIHALLTPEKPSTTTKSDTKLKSPEKIRSQEKIPEKSTKSPVRSSKSPRKSDNKSPEKSSSERFPKSSPLEKSDRHRRNRSPKLQDRFYKSPRISDRHSSSSGLKRLKSVIKIDIEPRPKKVKSQVVKKEEEYDPSKPVISSKKVAVNNLILKAVAEAQKSVTDFAFEKGQQKKRSIKDRLGEKVEIEKQPYYEEDLKQIVIKVPSSPKPKERISIRLDSTEESSEEEYEIIEEIVEENDEPTATKETKCDKDGDTEKEKDSAKDPKNKEIIVSIESSPKVILKERPLERPLQTVKPLKLPPMITKEPPQCKYWPTCTFKEKCIYPHPKCKFGSKCTKSDCAYKHEKDVCKFFPNCHSLSCNFFHPSPCRFGNGCKDKKCQLYHPGRAAGFQTPSSFPSFNGPPIASVPAKHLLTWKKNPLL